MHDNLARPERKGKSESTFGRNGFEGPSQIIGRLGRRADTWALCTAVVLGALVMRYGIEDFGGKDDGPTYAGIAARIADHVVEVLDQDGGPTP